MSCFTPARLPTGAEAQSALTELVSVATDDGHSRNAQLPLERRFGHFVSQAQKVSGVPRTDDFKNGQEILWPTDLASAHLSSTNGDEAAGCEQLCRSARAQRSISQGSIAGQEQAASPEARLDVRQPPASHRPSRGNSECA